MFKGFLNLKKFLLAASLLCGMLIIHSCGDIGEGPGPESKLEPLLDCDLGEAKFEEIFDKELTSEWECLTKTMDLFIRHVRNEHKNYLSLKSLYEYIDNNKPEMKDDKPLIKAFFQIANLIVGLPEDFPTDRDPDSLDLHISQANVTKIIDFLKILNKNAVVIARLMESETETPQRIHLQYSAKVRELATEISLSLSRIFNTQKKDEQELNLVNFLDTFINDENRDEIELAKSLVFAKRILLGCKKDPRTGRPNCSVENGGNSISNREVFYLINNLATYTTIAYDFVRFNKIIFQSEYDKFKLFDNDLSKLEELIFFTDSDISTELFKVSNLLDVAKHFEDEIGVDLSKHEPTVLNILDIVFGYDYSNIRESERDKPERLEERRSVTYGEFKEILKHGHNLFQKGIVFHDLYQRYTRILESSGPLTPEFLRDYEPVHEYEKINLTKFIKIVTDYRFFNDDVAPVYVDGYRRNAKAFYQIGLFEYLFDLVFRFIEKKYPCHNEIFKDYRCEENDKPVLEDYKATMTLRQVERLILDLGPLLQEMGIVIPGRESSSANNATLMSDLFQFQSDGKLKIQVPEATEFGASVFAAIEIGDKVLDKMKVACPLDWQYEDPDCQPTQNPDGTLDDSKCDITVNVPCVRENFFNVLFSDWEDDDGKLRNLKSNLPLLHKYVFEELSAREQMNFIIESELFARTCYSMDLRNDKEIFHPLIQDPKTKEFHVTDLPDVPMGRGDMLVILGGLLNIESTILRWDLDPDVGNANNRMDPKEVDEAYTKVYETAIKALVKTSSGKLVSQVLSKQIFQYIVKFGKVPGTADLIKFLVLDTNKKVPATRSTIATILKTISGENAKLCELKELEAEQNKDACKANPNNPDECPCMMSLKSEETRLKHCYPDIFGDGE